MSTRSSPVSEYYRDFMPAYLGIPREKMRLVPLGINMDGYGARPARRKRRRSRSATSRGSRRRKACTCWPRPTACCASARSRRAGAARGRRLPAAGASAATSTTIRAQDARSGDSRQSSSIAARSIAPQKIAFLQALDVLSVPTTYAEPKGMFLLEAMANGGAGRAAAATARSPRSCRTTGGGADRRARRSDGARRRHAWSSGAIPSVPRRWDAPARPACASTTTSGGWPKPPRAPTSRSRSATTDSQTC